MTKRHQLKLAVVGLATTALAGTTTAVAGPASAAQQGHAGNQSLATVLAADKGFDHDWQDFDILEKAVTTVLAAKPDSPVKVLAQGRTRLTAFIPTDLAFRRLAAELTGHRPRTERATFRSLARAAGVDTLEAVLLYHVVPGKTLGSGKVAKLDGASATTASGGSFTVRIKGSRISLVDRDPDARDPRVIAVDVNKGNKQIAHVIDRVLRPIDL